MFAALVAVDIEPAAQEMAGKGLTEVVVPMVKASPGFVAGYWFDLGGSGYSIVVFDTEENARATAPPEGASPMPGVTVTKCDIREVAASA